MQIMIVWQKSIETYFTKDLSCSIRRKLPKYDTSIQLLGGKIKGD